MNDFAHDLARVLKHEGGYSNNPRDPGGATQKGVTAKVYDAYRHVHGLPARDVREITDAELSDIYKHQYADAVHYDELHPGVSYAVFDAAVNSGPARAIGWLQHAAGVTPDCHFGFQTLQAVRAASPQDLIAKICSIRLHFLEGLPTWDAFGKGWAARVEDVRRDALSDCILPALPRAAPAPAKALAPPVAKLAPAMEHPLQAAVRTALEPHGADMSTQVASTLTQAAATVSQIGQMVQSSFPDEKSWWASQTIWGGAATIAASLAGVAVAWGNHDIAGVTVGVVAAAGGVTAIVGRVKAKAQIG